MSGDKLVSAHITRNEVISLVFRLTLFGALTYFGVRWMVKAIDPTRKQKVEAQKRAERILNRIGVKNVRLSEYELSIAAQLVDPSTINISWDDIAVNFSGSSLIQPPKGVLLHGPPGCGKTMIAKATAREAGARFINLEVSSLTDKWYGESQKLAAAVFTLAIKIQPCIIFIDEIDSFLRSRDTFDHEATAMMKAQFMSLWDGLITDPDCQVIVMGATNRPQDVDRAILRRMPSMFHIGLPNPKQRCGVLKLVLENEVISEDVNIEEIAKLTDAFSGSDLRELCRNAALYRVRDYCNAELKNKSETESSPDAEIFHDALRPISMEDFVNALSRMKDSKVHTSIKFRSRVPDLD
ncbi:ATPase family AAA domain-containing protein 1-B [Trichonephila inaurata madagascariensis]|uniref:ATPase family AAA domain-containing protein 1-B n=1 Tax=Trichonephila inaurata madagascariensis TaxID=2747483 RepID=A0A8X6Y1P1_9ARAC|nr:ATPase family AAA domain-containing protein 1-B [Trichonephila inaurata madagascariensis]